MIQDAIEDMGSAKFWRRFINRVTQPYKPLDDILFAVSDEEPEWIMNKMATRFPGARLDYHNAVSGGDGTPDITVLGKYDVVLAWSWDDWENATGMGNNLQSFINSYRRGVVLLSRSFDDNTDRELEGGIMSDGYSPFSPTVDDNVIYQDRVVYYYPGSLLVFGLGSNILTLEDTYRNQVTLQGEGVSAAVIWDDTPVSFTNTDNDVQLTGGLAYDTVRDSLFACDAHIDGGGGGNAEKLHGETSAFDHNITAKKAPKETD
jgi:hypothetical protein